ncbi:MAG: hypothetical protein HYZ28_03035 [Myxococcales bacterium]|nr:hypothetical protein [Myxococcales bacterium]
MRRAVSIAFAIVLLGGQATIGGAAAMVCRYTGRVMDGCQHPAASAPGDLPALREQCCCEMHVADAALLKAVTEDPTRRLQRDALLACAEQDQVQIRPAEYLTEGLAGWTAARPPGSPIYLETRHLLI